MAQKMKAVLVAVRGMATTVLVSNIPISQYAKTVDCGTDRAATTKPLASSSTSQCFAAAEQGAGGLRTSRHRCRQISS